MTSQVHTRTALITGASKNIGRAIALSFADAGYDVGLVANSDSAGLAEVSDEIRSRGQRVATALVDVSDATQCADLVEQMTGELGPIDVFVSNAARRPLQPLLEITPADWDAILASNLSATFYIAREILGSMKERSFGRVIAIGGPDGIRGFPNRAHNVACKAGIIGLMKAIAIEFGPYGVTANVVTPGMTDTTRDLAHYPDWPPTQEVLDARLHIPRLGKPEEIADACVFLASEKASYITGQNVHVSGGLIMQ